VTSIPSNYSINVAQAHPTRKQWGTDKPSYLHYCAIELGQCLKLHALNMLADTKERYPHPEFLVEMTYWECRGIAVND
jgi:hypothetical protein